MATTERKPITEHGVKLAVHLITLFYGNLVAKVCECLLRRGTLTKAQISRFTDLTPDQVKKCLWVLIQHNCAQAFALEQDGARGASVVMTHYMALFKNIFHIVRFGKFLTCVKEELDEDHLQYEFLKGFMDHGRLTWAQSFDRAVASLNKGSSECEDTYRKSFNKLVEWRLVERCPAAEPLVPLSSEQEPPAKKGGKKLAVKVVTLEERALAAAIPMDAERFCIQTDSVDDHDEGNFGKKSNTLKVGQKRKLESVQWDSELDVTGAKKNPIYRVNFDEFIHRLRIKACVEYARVEYDDTAAMVLHSMLEGAKSTESTVTMPLDSIYQEVIKTEKGRQMALDRVRQSLQQLHFCSEADDVFSVDLKDIIMTAQQEEVESIVRQRYGTEAFRIFRLLSKSKQLDTEKISGQALVDQKATPVLLFRLYKDNFVQMEKITTGGPRQADFFLWSVNKNSLQHLVLDELYHVALNLSLRCNYEVERERELLSRPREKLDGDTTSRRKHVLNVRNLLQASLMKIDDAIVLFSEF